MSRVYLVFGSIHYWLINTSISSIHHNLTNGMSAACVDIKNVLINTQHIE